MHDDILKKAYIVEVIYIKPTIFRRLGNDNEMIASNYHNLSNISL